MNFHGLFYLDILCFKKVSVKLGITTETEFLNSFVPSIST